MEIGPGEPLRWGLNPKGVAKYSDFKPFEGYISETMQAVSYTHLTLPTNREV